MMKAEPSILDYLKSRLWPRRYPRVEIPLAAMVPPHGPDRRGDSPVLEPGRTAAAPAAPVESALNAEPAVLEQITGFGAELPAADAAPEPAAWVQRAAAAPFPWLVASGAALALLGQAALGPGSERSGWLGAGLFAAALACIGAAVLRGGWTAPPAADAPIEEPFRFNPINLWLGLILSAAALVFFFGHPPEFKPGNLILLGGGLYLVVSALWTPSADRLGQIRSRLHALRRDPRLTITIDPPAAAALLAVAAVLFFRFYRLGDVPPEMNSDHAEKLIDILRVVNGERPIFFAGNGGREALIFYLGAALHSVFGMEPGFMLLKIGSTLIGAAALSYVYGLGNEYGGRRLGWLAFTLMGIAYWPNVVARFGLRLPFYMLFTAAVMYHLVSGYRRGRRSDFIWAGVWLGVGMYGYTPDRLLPLTVLLAAGLYLLHHRRSPEHLRFGIAGLLVVALVSLVLFIPLLGYILSEPQAFLARTLTRVTATEHPILGSPLFILLDNYVRALKMFSRDAGEIWPISIPHYPALGVAAGGLFMVGLAAAVTRYFRSRRWPDLFLPLSIPLLLLPSTLALAFPSENPNLYRAGGAAIPVFVLAAAGLDGLMRAFTAAGRPRLAPAAAALLLCLAAIQDYTWVFDEYQQQYRMASWNSSEIGSVARDAAERNGGPDTVFVIGYPHWVDTRLVAINAGYPDRDFEIFTEQLETTLGDPRPRLFILNKDDTAAVEALRRLHPQGVLSFYQSKVPTKEFQLYFVPPQAAP